MPSRTSATLVGPLGTIAGAIGAAFASVFKDATLHRVTGRTADGRGGWTQAYTHSACRALVLEYTDWMRLQAGIPDDERKVMVLALSGGSPAIGDRITAEGREWAIIETTQDPANATYECRAKPAARTIRPDVGTLTDDDGYNALADDDGLTILTDDA